jgi:hypothetical protein
VADWCLTIGMAANGLTLAAAAVLAATSLGQLLALY